MSGFSSTTRLLPVSATYTTPFATATSFGNEKAVDSHVVVPSVGDQRETRLLKVSATIRSGPADAMPKGQCSWLASLPTAPRNAPVGTPSRVNCSSRLFLVSDTQIVFVALLIVMSRGQLNPVRSVLPQPRFPNDSCQAPVAVANRCTRWLTLSDTNVCESTARPDGSLKPPLRPGVPPYVAW